MEIITDLANSDIINLSYIDMNNIANNGYGGDLTLQNVALGDQYVNSVNNMLGDDFTYHVYAAAGIENINNHLDNLDNQADAGAKLYTAINGQVTAERANLSTDIEGAIKNHISEIEHAWKKITGPMDFSHQGSIDRQIAIEKFVVGSAIIAKIISISNKAITELTHLQ